MIFTRRVDDYETQNPKEHGTLRYIIKTWLSAVILRADNSEPLHRLDSPEDDWISVPLQEAAHGRNRG